MANLKSLVSANTPVAKVKVIAFNRPEKRNALSQALIDDFLREISAASHDADVNAIVVTGNASCFSAGADIKEIAALDTEAAQRGRYLEDLCKGMAAVRKPLIAAVEGMALGGGFEVALMCDLIMASEEAYFGLPEVTIGLIPGAGGTQRLTNAMGKYKAMRVILFGSPITSREAEAHGIVSNIYEPGTVLENSIKVASQLAQFSSGALSLAKEAICRCDNQGRDDEFERSLYYSAFSSSYKVEGIAAFLEKRPAKWP
ncbi:ClpP/crotonase-like domain-containing protein [Xylariales sp. AK1849]|nr:ClpP/crotonase-like domain-containing protein [Xylariales sp. AK1849]